MRTSGCKIVMLLLIKLLRICKHRCNLSDRQKKAHLVDLAVEDGLFSLACGDRIMDAVINCQVALALIPARQVSRGLC